MWMMVPLNELVQDSDLIIVGTLEGVSQYSKDGVDYAQGTIRVNEVIWGSANVGDLLALKWQNASNIICPRVEHRHNQSKMGLWLLTVESGGDVRADYPGRFVELGERSKVERFLMKNKVSLRGAQSVYGADEPVNISVVFRNPTQSFMEFPGVEKRDDVLFMNPNVEIRVARGLDEQSTPLTPLPGGVLLSETLSSIALGPREAFRLTVDLRKFFDLVAGESYSVQMHVKGLGTSNTTHVYPQGLSRAEMSNKATVATGVRESPRASDLGFLMSTLIGIVASIFFV